MNRMPALFIGHGSPMNALETNPYTQAWRDVAQRMPLPNAIVCISAHWQTRGSAVTAMSTPKTIHDFGGFPKPLFEVQYPAPGSPTLAARVSALLAPVPVAQDAQAWGLDHGAWSILVHLYPEANVPVVQLSLDATLTAAEHYALAKKLAPLRDEGVLILGSGNVVHNLPRMQWRADAPAYDWAQQFNDQVKQALKANDHASLIKAQTLNEAARLSIPTLEHYWPFLYVIAQQQADDRVELFADEIALSSISMLCCRIAQG